MKSVGLFLSLSLLSALSFARPQPGVVEQRLQVRTDCQLKSGNVYICADSRQRDRVLQWISEIRRTQVGDEFWSAISTSDHRLLIEHFAPALISAGKTRVALTSKLDNGTGDDAVIQMHLGIPDSGSHRVGGVIQEWAHFNARVNFFHELSHARHALKGTSEIVRLEKQAIADENIFRAEWARLEGVRPELRSDDYDKGEQIWTPDQLLSFLKR